MKKNIYIVIFFINTLIFISPALAAPCQLPDVCLQNPLGPSSEDANINLFLGQIIYGILGVVGSLALVMFIYGGLVWMTAAGSPEKVTKGKNVLIWATIGLVVIFSAYAIVAFILKDILGQT